MVTNDSDTEQVANDNVVTFKKGGVLSVYYDDKDGNRKMIGMKTLQKNLSTGESLNIPIQFTKEDYDKISPDHKVLTVVYAGKIGAENGVAVKQVNISDFKAPDIPKITDGAVDMYLSWNYQCDIDMDLGMNGPNTQYDIQDIAGYGKEHAYVKSLYELRPGYHYDFSANGEQIEGSTLTNEKIEDDPIMIRALLETPTGSYFKEWEVQSFDSLNIGNFAEMDVKEKIIPKWICPALNNVPNWHRPYNEDTGKFECVQCEAHQNYSIQVQAQSSAGESDRASVHMNIKDLPDVPPTLKPLKTTFSEILTAGEEIARVKVADAGDRPIEIFEINGTDLFDIDESGMIFVAKKAVCSSQQHYSFTVTAVSASGRSEPVPVALDKVYAGHARFGYLADADADVKIYKIEQNGTKVLKWQESSSKNKDLNATGVFYAHGCELEQNTDYLYEVTGGKNWDTDNNGFKDENATQNHTKTRAIVSRDDILDNKGRFHITLVSELLYENVAKYIKYLNFRT